MVKDGQVRRLWREMESPVPLVLAARRAGMSEKTARHYRDHRQLPSTRKTPRNYRTRVDPFADVWPMVEERLRAEPRLLAKTLFDWLRLQLHFPSSSHTQAASSSRRSARAFIFAFWPRPDIAA